MKKSVPLSNKLLENGLKYIVDSARCLTENAEAIDIQFILLHLYAGIENIMQAYLYTRSFTYIFADMNQADKEILVYGDFEVAGYYDCIERIENLCDVVIPEKDKRAFLDIWKKKNSCAFFGEGKKEQDINVSTLIA